MQVTCANFEERVFEKDPQKRKDMAVDLSVELVCGIALDYAKGKVPKLGLKKERDARLKLLDSPACPPPRRSARLVALV